MSRRRKTFGASAREHSSMGERAAQSAIDEAARSMRSVAQGNCDAGARHLLDASWYAGEVVGHSRSGSIPNLTLAIDDVSRARVMFERGCDLAAHKRRSR